MEKTDLLGLTEEELMDLAKAAGEAPFRGKQIFKWLSRPVSRQFRSPLLRPCGHPPFFDPGQNAIWLYYIASACFFQ